LSLEGFDGGGKGVPVRLRIGMPDQSLVCSATLAAGRFGAVDGRCLAMPFSA